MGSEISTAEDFENFQKNFIFQKQLQCQNYGEIKLLKHPINDAYVAIKTKLLQGVLDPKQLEETALEQKNMLHENMVECIKVFCNNHEELCGRYIKIHLVYEYLPNNLEHELEARALKSEFYTESELILLINSIVSALLYLKSLKKFHGDINPQHILISKDGKYKLTDIQFLTEFDEYKRFFVGLGEKCYLSPILFRALGHRSLEPTHNPEKSCVFSLGIMLIQMSLLEFPDNIYIFDSFEIDENALKNTLNKKALSLYSERFQRLLLKMLEFDEKERIDYEGILKELELCKNNISISVVLERESVEKPKKSPMVIDYESKNFRPSPAKTLERETLFDNEEDIMLNIPQNNKHHL